MRRTYAALLCFVWLLGVEVLPNLHLAGHDEKPHTHSVDGTIITVSFDAVAHSHDGVVHSHAAKKRTARGVLAIDVAPDSHAAQGLAHHAAALLSSPLPIVDVVRIDRVDTHDEHRETGRAAFAPSATRDARGPPSA